jgi:hypothetical protein
MKKILYVATVLSLAARLSLTAPAAFAQTSGSAEIVFAAISGDAPEIEMVTKAVRRELERSRHLTPIYVDDESKARLTIPTGLLKDAAGENLTVKYELRTAKRLVEEQQVTCPTKKVANCARDIIIAAEKFVRNNKDR